MAVFSTPVIASGGSGLPSSSACMLKTTHDKNVLHCLLWYPICEWPISSTSRFTVCSLGCYLYSRHHNFLPRSLPAFSYPPSVFLASIFGKHKGPVILPLNILRWHHQLVENRWCVLQHGFLLSVVTSFPLPCLLSLHTWTVMPQLWLLVTSLAWLKFWHMLLSPRILCSAFTLWSSLLMKTYSKLLPKLSCSRRHFFHCTMITFFLSTLIIMYIPQILKHTPILHLFLEGRNLLHWKLFNM